MLVWFKSCKSVCAWSVPQVTPLKPNRANTVTFNLNQSSALKFWCSRMINRSYLVSELQFWFAEITANAHFHCKLAHWHWALLKDLFVWDCFWREVPEEQVTSAERTPLTRICIYKHTQCVPKIRHYTVLGCFGLCSDLYSFCFKVIC